MLNKLDIVDASELEPIPNADEPPMKTAVSFLGKQDQIPPKFSAIKINGSPKPTA